MMAMKSAPHSQCPAEGLQLCRARRELAMCGHQALLDRWRRARRALASITLAALMVANAPAGAGNWDHAHGDAGNTGFYDVVTLPATVASGKVDGLGPYAPGAGPVIGPDGTIYLGSFDGW